MNCRPGWVLAFLLLFPVLALLAGVLAPRLMGLVG
jgi:hypothetical protein